jgi:hypothetical protein
MKIKGIIETRARNAEIDRKPNDPLGRRTFLFRRTDNGEQISCVTGLKFSGSVPCAGISVELTGEFPQPLTASGLQIPYLSVDEIAVIA